MIPTVYISNYNGRLGNHMFQFAWAKALSIDLEYELSVPGIACDWREDVGSLFPKTHFLRKISDEQYRSISSSFFEVIENSHSWIKDSCVDIEYFKNNFSTKSIRGVGYFQNYHAFKKHKEIIKEYFSLDYDERGKDTLGMHIRLTDFVQAFRCSYEYHAKCIELTNCERVEIFTDEPSHSIVQRLKQNYPNVNINNQTNDRQVLSYMSSCDEISICKSTYSWWGGFLSKANKVYFPSTPKDDDYFADKFLFVDDEERYLKINE